MQARLTSSHFVGRVGELAELELALREAAASRPVLVLLGGDSGVGKTRLVTELERRIGAGQVAGNGDAPPLVLRGESVEQGEGELPYAPLLSAMRPLVRERHPALAALSPGSRAQLAALLPGLDDAPAAAERHDPAAQLRLFEALLELLDLLSAERPLALILEDVHWADRSTRTFLAFLARSLRQERVMLLLTYRTDELHRRHALRPLLSELERLDRARRIEIAPFDRDELAEALTDILGDAPGPDLIERLFMRSEGNPLYIEELLAAGLDGRGAAPQSLRDAFLLRIERLPPDAQRAARAIAVGRRLDEAAISDVTGIAPAELTPALREAVAEQVLVAGEDGQLSFRHALLREALYDDLLPGERSDLHLTLARHFEALPASTRDRDVQRATLVASHYAAAGEQPAALRASVRAARAARQIHAYGEAADLAERALELWPRVPEPQRPEGVDHVDHVDLLVLAAAAHSIVDDRGRSEVLLRSALDELDADADPGRYASVLDRLSRVQWQLNRGLEAVETAQRALAMLPEHDASCDRASLMSWLARSRFLRGRFRTALSDGEEALGAAMAAGDPEAEVEVLNTLGMTRIALGEVDEGIRCLRRAIDIARERDNLDGLSYAYSNLADLLHLRGRSAEGLGIIREGVEAIPRRMGVARDWLVLTMSELELETGDWKGAEAHLGPGPSHLTGVLLIFRLLREADLALGLGEDDRAAACLDRAEPLVAQSSEPQYIGVLGALLGELRRRRGDLAGARAAVAHALDRIELCTDDVMRIARATAAGARIEADAAQRARDLREKRDERDAIARVRIHVQRLRALAADGGPVERAWSGTGAAELSRARGRNDPAAWARVARDWEALGRPYAVAQVRWREAEARIESGDRAGATEPLKSALEIARRLGSGWLERELIVLAERARLDLGSDGAGRARARLDLSAEGGAGEDGAAEDPFGLTARERQVLELLAQGATNRQIGAALFMAEKTASVHVSRILSKLGVRSRTQAAAVAHRMHLHA